jgi:hypothetical protein
MPLAEVFADERWYRQAAEAEQVWEGVLEPAALVRGPDSRAALSYRLLATDGRSLPVYAAGAEDRLRLFSAQHVRVRAKLIDLGSEGFGEELWIGTIETQR